MCAERQCLPTHVRIAQTRATGRHLARPGVHTRRRSRRENRPFCQRDVTGDRNPTMCDPFFRGNAHARDDWFGTPAPGIYRTVVRACFLRLRKSTQDKNIHGDTEIHTVFDRRVWWRVRSELVSTSRHLCTRDQVRGTSARETLHGPFCPRDVRTRDSSVQLQDPSPEFGD